MTVPVAAVPAARQEVPRLTDDYTADAARRRLAFLTEATGVSPEHLGRYSFDPEVLAGNIENFVGVAQVPIGIAGPLLIDGEDARGTFYVPLATNVAESSAALVHTEVLADGSYYYSITIPALIVATYGGGTGLPTQRECLELLGCYGPGRVRKLAEIVAAAVLCGEVSLGAAVVADEWVTAHERLGRNRL
jgi:hydroxymethylglutaryl-CoA reductase